VAERGWIKLHRQLQECPIWYGDRFSKGQAWVDLLLLANHRDKKILFNGEIQTIGRGQYLTSTVKLAEKWGWNRKTVSSYLKLLEQDKMITKVSDNTKTLITIENYEVFQGIDEEVDNSLDNPLPNPTDNPADNLLDTNNNIKNDKNNIIYNNRAKKSTNFTPPTVEEVQAYCQERNNKVDAQAFVDFYSSKGWMVGKNKMKDWKAAVRTWERNRKDDGGGGSSGGRSRQGFPKQNYDFDALEKELGI
jgi:hypothetical protein